jgi:large subunit ribosomal protein L16
MLAPKKIVHKKVHKISSRRGTLQRGSTLIHDGFGLKAIDSNWLTSRQIEAARMSISRRTKGGVVHTRVFPSIPVTKKGLAVPMGSGVGGIEYFMFPVKPGRVIFEVSGLNDNEAMVTEALRIAAHKLPFRCKIVSKKKNIFL